MRFSKAHTPPLPPRKQGGTKSGRKQGGTKSSRKRGGKTEIRKQRGTNSGATLLFIVVMMPMMLFAQEQVQRRIAVTIDDLPAQRGELNQLQEITDRLLTQISEYQIPVVGFVNEGKLYRQDEVDERIALLRKWLDAGHELGNHTFSHQCNNDLPVEEYEEEIIRGESVLRMLMNEYDRELRYFRHPCLFTGPTAEYKGELDNFLSEHGYTVAPVTVDNSEWLIAAVFERAMRDGKTELADSVAATYVPHMEAVMEHYENMSTEFLGYELPQILLCHANELNAEYFHDVVEMLKRRGYEFITLEEALKDSAYSLPEAPNRRGTSWLHRWREAKGLDYDPEPDAPEWVMKLYQEKYR
jgi:peptidoglycan/xylan/chitin deacetylase (PgdA/CDA1 family)